MLLDRFSDLVARDQHHSASLLRHIDAIDQRQLWAKQGYPSLFELCVSRYHMSESTAGKRIGAARIARRFPVIFEMVSRGEIHLSGIHCLKAHLTPENRSRPPRVHLRLRLRSRRLRLVHPIPYLSRRAATSSRSP